MLTTAAELGVAIGTATLVTIAATGQRLAFAITAVLAALAALLLARTA